MENKKTKIKCSYYLQKVTDIKVLELYLHYSMNGFKTSKSEIVERAINLLYETTITKQ
jgi:hypothetical protein